MITGICEMIQILSQIVSLYKHFETATVEFGAVHKHIYHADLENAEK